MKNNDEEVERDIFYGVLGKSQYVDENGRPIARTPLTHPYSYDSYVIWGNSDGNSSGALYSDRLFQWNPEKYNRLCVKHFGDKGQHFDNRDPAKVEAFLRDYFDKPKLVLTMIMRGCNVSSGYPLWIFFYKEV